MAAKGLETVRQKFSVDTEEYIAGIKEMIDYNELFIDSIRLVQEQIKGIGKALGDIDNKEIKITVDAKQAIAEIASVKAALAGLGDRTIHIRAVSDAFDDLGDNASDAAAAVREVGAAVGGGDSPGSGGFLGGKANAINDAIASIKDEIDALLASQGKATADTEKQGKAIQGLAGDTDKATLAMQRFEAANAKAMMSFDRMMNAQKGRFLSLADDSSKNAANLLAGVEEVLAGKIIADRFQASIHEKNFNAALTDMFGPVGGAAPGGSGGLAGDVAAQIAAGVARGIAAAGASGPAGNAYAAAFYGGSAPTTPGGGFPLPPGGYFHPGYPAGFGGGTFGAGTQPGPGRGGIGGFIGGLLAGGAYGGGGPSGGGGFGGLGGFFTGGGQAGAYDPGSAIGKFATVAAAIGRVYPLVHWAIMLGSELLATAGPAAVALGGAALVGTEGAQQLVNRYQAMSAVQESIGAATGQSIATFLHVPPTLQNLQSQYGSGEVYGLAGAGINALRTGGGNAFLQLGQNTLSMISGAAADFVLAMKGGLGNAAGAIVQGGAQYAQQFGDVLDNIGKVFLNTAPNLPGVGSMLLTTLQAGTGGLADVTKALGPGLLPLLGFEAGTRYGPTIVGGAAAGLANLLPFGLGGKLATAAHAATAADVAAGAKNATTGALAAVGEPVAAEEGAGIAGILGALTAPEIGALAVATIAVTRGLTGKTAAQQKYAGLATSMTEANLAGNLSQIAGAAFPGGALPPTQLGSAWDANLSAKQLGSILGGGISQIGSSQEDILKQLGAGSGFGVHAGVIPDLLTGKWSAGLHSLGNIWQDVSGPGGVIHGLGQLLGIVGPAPDPAQAALQQMGTAFSTWSNMLGVAPQVQGIWKDMGSGALSTAASLNVLAQSGVNINTAFQKNGELTAKASQQVKDYVAGYQAMTGTVPGGATGGTLDAINAVGVAGGLQASKLATVNSALDQIVQIASGGTAGGAALTQLVAAVPKGLAQGTLTAAGAAATTAFASTTQPSVMSQLQQQTDWLRTAQVLGAFGAGGTTQAGMAKFLIGQAFGAPGVAQTPSALAQLSTVGQEYGMAPLTPGETAKQYDAAFKSFLKGADSAKQYGEALTATTEKVSSVPADYKNFVTTATGGAQSGLANAINLFGQSVQQQFMGSFARGGPSAQMEKQYANVLAAAGFKPQAAGDVAGYAAKVGGATPAQIQQVIHGVIKWTNQYETPHPPPAGNPPPIKYPSTVQKPIPPPPTPGGKVQYSSAVTRPVPPPAPAGGTVVYHSIVIPPGVSGPIGGTVPGAGGTRIVAGQHGFKVPGWGGGDIHPAFLEGGEAVVPKHLVPALAPFLSAHKVPGFASGGLMYASVPSFAGMDLGVRSALQDVATELLGFIQQAMGSQNGSPIGRFAGPGVQISGGGGNTTHGTVPDPIAVHIVSVANAAAAAIGSAGLGGDISNAGKPASKAAQKIFDAFEKTFKDMPGPWNKVASEILNGLIDGIKNAPKETAAAATALVNKVKTEIAFGQSVTNTAVAGLNFGGMQVATPTMTAQGQPYQYYTDQQNIAAGGQPGSVQEQMGSYLQAMQSFQGDMGKLAKGGLQKRLMSQLFAAGPIQGDAEAQSILGGAGGIKAANQLYNQINSLATKLGVAAIGDVYGTPKGKTVTAAAHVTGAAQVHALQTAINSLHGKTVTIKVNVVSSGGTPGSSSKVSPAETKAALREIQKSALQQAKNNRGTNLTLPGYGS